MNELKDIFQESRVSWNLKNMYVGNKICLSEEAIIESGLDWEVEKTDLYHMPMTDKLLDNVPTHKAIVRQIDNKVLGVVGNRYVPIQNKEAFKFMDTLVEQGLMRYHSVGSLRDGQRIWILGKIGSFEVINNDQIDEFIFLWNSHDGSSSLRCFPTTIRIVCSNMIKSMFNRAKGIGVSVKHTANILENLEQAKEILAESSQSLKQFREFSKIAANFQMNTSKINQFVENVFPLPPKDVRTTHVDKVRATINELMETGYGTDILGVQGTGWGAFNAVTEYMNHHKRSRGKNKEERRFESILFGNSSTIINKAANEIVKMAA